MWDFYGATEGLQKKATLADVSEFKMHIWVPEQNPHLYNNIHIFLRPKRYTKWKFRRAETPQKQKPSEPIKQEQKQLYGKRLYIMIEGPCNSVLKFFKIKTTLYSSIFTHRFTVYI